MFIDDTIVAVATAPGEGGIGIIRISGKKSLEIAEHIFKSNSNKRILDYKLRTLIYGKIIDQENVIDEVLLAYMKSPNSYTVEDVIEINCHGGFISIKKILDLILSKGARLAEPGEFTKRAFLNGRIDLSQAEAVIDIINAKTEKSHEIAQNQLEGSISNKINNLREKVTELLAHLEVAIDYPEEDIEHITMKKLKDNINVLNKEIDVLLESSQSGKILRDGLKTVIVGRPNVGKSSLLNLILGEKRAIVTNIPGTTRDVIEEYVNINGIPIKLIDTAGIRDTEDLVEKIGVEKSKDYLISADLVIMVFDFSEKLKSDDLSILKNINKKKTIVILNKTDLERKIEIDKINEYISKDSIIEVSAIKNEGIDKLSKKIEYLVYNGRVKNSSDILINNSRHIDAIKKAKKSILEAKKAIEVGMPFDFVEVDLKNAWECLGYINGDVVSEDLLDNIFSKFCIGK